MEPAQSPMKRGIANEPLPRPVATMDLSVAQDPQGDGATHPLGSPSPEHRHQTVEGNDTPEGVMHDRPSPAGEGAL